MARKGIVAEIFSKAIYNDKPQSYIVGYIDRGTTKEVTLEEFLKRSENFEIIPATRIAYIKKENNILYSKTCKISKSF
ncbi:MAG: DUF504 domain-containing protein [Thaumarchaeota archaeon]|nr:DUF504 domain-containing protein [Nitrososphaerota archaeon]MDE1830786.1 DUF504 domain-containing protein [Nitrososphaerota archaeon]MDE1840737.1 DUF504 domain-containing protein [Nitrososphaerota archaeon]MDE1877774.1 DUF504 domain-containing protein [Nitrososphaerota archaeon]